MFNLRKILYLPKSDRRAVIFLLTGLIVVGGGLRYFGSETTAGSPEEADTTAAFPLTDDTGTTSEPYYAVPERKVERFAFDPNTADSTQLLRLGLLPWQVRNIYKYRAKGGIYRQKEDFARLYGLTVKQYRELEPYIRISDDYRPAAEVIHSPGNHEPMKARETLSSPSPQEEGSITTERQKAHTAATKLAPGQTVSLSHADTTQLQRVPGIGPYFARRIVEYRERLGGFYDVAQLTEIENFPEQALDYIDLGTVEIRKINVNKLSLAQLRRHPYISYYQAKAITEYRRLYGFLKSIDDMSAFKDFTDDDLQRLQPYLEY